MEKRRVITTLLCAVLIFSLIFSFSSCIEKGEEDPKDTTVELSLQGVSATKTLTVYLINESTGEKTEFRAKKKEGYKSSQELDYGNYIIEKIKPRSKDYEVVLVTERFNVSEEAPAYVVIEVVEEDVTGTWRWFLEKNAFTLGALVISCIAYAVVKAKKKYRPPQSPQSLQ